MGLLQNHDSNMVPYVWLQYTAVNVYWKATYKGPQDVYAALIAEFDYTGQN